MKPGRELDALIAEKVMGWVRRRVKLGRQYDNHGNPFLPATVKWEAEALVFGERVYILNQEDTQPYNRLGLLSYSTDIAAAWLVVGKINLFLEKQTDKSNGCSNYVQLWQGKDGKWVVGNWEDRLFILAEGETAPHAICLAALRIVGVDETNRPTREDEA